MISKPLSDVESNHPFNVALVHEYITKRHLGTRQINSYTRKSKDHLAFYGSHRLS